MSGTSSSTSSSTSGRGSRSSNSPDRVSMSSVSPARMLNTDQRVGQLGHALLVGSSDDQRACSVVEQFLQRDDFARELARARQHDVQRFVEHDLGTARQLFFFELGMQRDAHLAPAGEHVDRAVLIASEERAVRRRRPRRACRLLRATPRCALGPRAACTSASRSATPPARAVLWSRAAAPRVCARASARPATGVGAR